MMNKYVSIGLATVLSSAGLAAVAQQSTPRAENAANAKEEVGAQMAAKAMDANNDGLVSREEYVSYSEGLYAKLKKDNDGQVDLKDMAAAISAIGREPTSRAQSERQPVAAATPKQQPTAAATPKQQPAAAVAPSQQSTRSEAADPRSETVPASGQGLQAQMKSMDANSDGLVSRAEYMAHYEAAFAKMRKDSAGMIVVKDIG